MRAKEFIFEASGYYEYAKKMSEKYGVPYSIVKHALNKETGHISDPNKRAKAVSPVGAGGVMQLMPKTAKSLGVRDRFDPYQNIEGGVKYLSQLYKRYNDPVLTLAAYNAGPGNVKKYGGVPPFKETQKYVMGYNPDKEETIKLAQQPEKAPVEKSSLKAAYSDVPITKPSIKSKIEKAATDLLALATGSSAAMAGELPPEKKAEIYKAGVPTDKSTEYYSGQLGDTQVKKGQSMSSIAKEKGVSLPDLIKMNPEISDPNKIKARAFIRTKPSDF